MSDELSKLKSMVRRFLKEIRGVPMRAIDCDQEKVHELMGELHEATRIKRKVRVQI